MPSPVGHLLAGVAVAWTVDPRADRRMLAAAAALAALPDIDLALPFQHRTITHSLVAVAVVTIIAGVVTRQVTRRPLAGAAAMCGIAYGSHLLLDWLSADQAVPYGLQIFWPFADRFYISGWSVFALTERRAIFTLPTIVQNIRTIAQEIAILAPIVLALWLVRVKALAGLPPEVTGRHHAPK